MIYPQVAELEQLATQSGLFSGFGGGTGRIARVGQWLKDSF